MKQMLPIRCALLLIAMSGAPVKTSATDYGIFVDGGFGSGETDMNDLVDRRVDGARMVFDARHPGGRSTRATTKAELEAQIRAITCGAGDSITLVMVGHGRAGGKSSEESFYFALAPDGPAQRVSADELKAWLEAATIGCECEIHIVIFSCHSGAFINDLFMDPHVQSVFTSCQSDELTYTDAFTDGRGFQDRGDWMSGFNDCWGRVAAGADPGAALEEAAEWGWAGIPINYGEVQKPAGWRRGEIPVKAHVESSSGRNPKSVKVRFWSPSWLRCFEFSIPVERGVVFPRSFDECEWIDFDATFGMPEQDGEADRNNSRMTGNPAVGAAPTETVLAHVEGGDRRRGEVSIHTFAPNWEACKRRTLKVGDGVAIDPEVRRCSWIEQAVTVTDPDGGMSTAVPVAPASPKVPIVAHIENPQAGRNTVGVTIRRPAFLQRLLGPIKIRLRGRQRELLPQLVRCDLIRATLCLRQVADNTYEVSEIAEIDAARGFSFGNDAGLDRIVSPPLVYSLAQLVVPRCLLRNAGEQPLEAVSVIARIFAAGSQVYIQSQSIPFLVPDSQSEVVFPGWRGEVVGDYRIEFEVMASGDENLANNALALDFTLDLLDSRGPAWTATHLETGATAPFTAVENDVTLTGFGTGFGNGAESAAWLYQPLDSDVEVTTYLGVQEAGARAGLLARVNMDEGAPFAACVVEPGVGVKVYARAIAGGAIAEIGLLPELSFPIWIRLGRESDLMVGQASVDGSTWINVGFAEFPALPQVLLAGPVVYSDSAGQVTVRFGELDGFPTASAIISRPAQVRAEVLGPDRVVVEWVDRSETEIGFELERAEGTGSFAPLVQLPPEIESYTDTDLKPATLYTYRVRAMKQLADSEWSEAASIDTSGPGLEAWSSAFGIADPLASEMGGQAPVFSYFSGDVPSPGTPSRLAIAHQAGEFFVQFEKGVGIYDVQAEIEELDDQFETWSTLYTLGSEFPSGEHKFLLPEEEDGTGIFRVKLSLVP